MTSEANLIIYRLLRTSPRPWVVAPRLVAGGVLVAMGALPKLTQSEARENVTAMLELGGMPMPGVMVFLVAIGEAIAGLLLIAGLLSRVGAAFAVALMLGAAYTHVSVDFSALPHPEGAPPHFMPLLVLIPAGVVAWTGGGKWSIDRALAGGG